MRLNLFWFRGDVQGRFPYVPLQVLPHRHAAKALKTPNALSRSVSENRKMRLKRQLDSQCSELRNCTLPSTSSSHAFRHRDSTPTSPGGTVLGETHAAGAR